MFIYFLGGGAVVLPYELRQKRTGSCWDAPGKLESDERQDPAMQRRWPGPTPGSPFGSNGSAGPSVVEGRKGQPSKTLVRHLAHDPTE